MESFLPLRSWLAQLLGTSFNGDRNLYQEFGYKTQLRAEDFYAMYWRNDIAQRIIKAYPQATWRDKPEVSDGGDKFTKQFDDLYKKHKLSNYLERADRLSGIGHFGLLLMGFQDGKSMAQPLEKGNHPLMYLQPYGEHNVTVTQWNMNSTSARFGLPETYTVQTGNPMVGQKRASRSINVHHSRVLHISEFLDEDETYGIPRLVAVYNRLQDLEKVVGGSSEVFWLNARQGLAMNADKDANFSTKDKDKLKEQAEEYQHKLRRIMTTQGVDIKQLTSDIADPSKNVGVIIDLISGTTGIPKRILLGNEAGELASSQDETNWNARVDERRNVFAAPMMLRPFIDKMILTGNLPEPKDGLTIEWDEADALDEKTIAEIDEKRANTVDKLDRVGFPWEVIVQAYFPNKTEEEAKKIVRERGMPNEMP